MSDLDSHGPTTGSHPVPAAHDRLHDWSTPLAEAPEPDRALDALRREVRDLRDALSSQPVIDQAKGALMLRYGVDADSAFGLMVRWSQNANVKVRDIAAALVHSIVEGACEVGDPELARELAHVLGSPERDVRGG